MGINLRVTPSVLQSESGEITEKINGIEAKIQLINEQIKSSKNYWEGDASNTHQGKYKAVETEIKSTIKRLKEHPSHLLKMAGLYKKTEEENQTLAQTLPNNPIE